MENLKGCVYFFRHIGLSPIKIGYSANESPMDRFNQFKTYAPYGAEILGFIITDEPYEIEKKLHFKYSGKNINGEWFDILESDVNKEIDFYSKNEDTKDRNNFQLAWANELLKRKERLENESRKSNFGLYGSILESLPNEFTTKDVKDRCSIFNVSVRSGLRWLTNNTGIFFNKISHGVYLKKL